ncbi:MAG: hypothetical protein Q7J52_22540 [Falsiroseomonas sp.]|nr:hypothetical protein [Falsiroseomonas sp.]
MGVLSERHQRRPAGNLEAVRRLEKVIATRRPGTDQIRKGGLDPVAWARDT